MDKRDSRDGSHVPSGDNADQLHFSNQIRFIEIFLELADREYKAGQIPAGDRARRTARDAFEELKTSMGDESNASKGLLSTLKGLEERFESL